MDSEITNLTIGQLFSSYFIVFAITVALVEAIFKIKKLLMYLYNKKKGKDDKNITLSKLLEDYIKLNEKIDKLIDKINDLDERQNKSTVASFRDKIANMHDKFMSQKYITNEQLKIFNEAVKVYEEAGGDDIVHDKIKPDILSLQLRKDDKYSEEKK